MREMRNLDCRSFDDIARDLRITSTDLDAFVRRGRMRPMSCEAAEGSRHRRSGIGPVRDGGASRHAAGLRLMRAEAQCNNDLEIGICARDYEDYCLNAPTMNAHRRGREVQDA
jgi:hypothetical protein